MSSRLDIHIYVHQGRDDKLEEILGHVRALTAQGAAMSQQLDALTAEVAQDTDVISSAITLIKGLEAQIIAAGTDPAKLDALRVSLAASRQSLAEAIAEGTPAEPPPTP